MASKAAAAAQAGSSEVESVIASYPAKIQTRIRRLRKLILSTASSIPEVGPITETLKWGEPAFLTEKSRSGSTIRIAWKPKSPEQYAVYLNCQTTLVDTYRTLFPELDYEGNRAVVFNASDPLPEAEVRRCFELALTYHIAKKRKR